jgi:hypothetical protein
LIERKTFFKSRVSIIGIAGSFPRIGVRSIHYKGEPFPGERAGRRFLNVALED